MTTKCIQYELKRWAKPFLTYTCLLIALCGLTIWVHGMETPIELYVEEVPDELIRFVGIERETGQEICRQLFFALLSIVSMIAVGMACAGIVHGVKKEEREGSLLYYFNQPWSKGSFWTIKFGAAAFRVVGLWMIYLIECLFAVKFMQTRLPAVYSGDDSDLIFSMAVRGLGILVFSFGMCLLYCARTKRGVGIDNFVMTVYAWMFLLGNAHKVSELLLYYMRAAQRDVGALEKVDNIVERLGLLYPFTYLDMLHGNAFPLAAMAGYGIVGVAMTIGAWGFYCRKKIAT